eukprot:SAG31_NODE_11138_length_1062_cov_0.932503_1_plen_226_part_10
MQRFIVPLVYPALRQIGHPMPTPGSKEDGAEGAEPAGEQALDADGKPLPALPGATGSAADSLAADDPLKRKSVVKETMADKPSVLQEVAELKNDMKAIMEAIKKQGDDLNQRFEELEKQEKQTKAITEKPENTAAVSSTTAATPAAPAVPAPAATPSTPAAPTTPAVPTQTGAGSAAAPAAVSAPADVSAISSTTPIPETPGEAPAPAPEKSEMSKKLFDIKPKKS